MNGATWMIDINSCHEKWDNERYEEYINDLAIARNELIKMKLMPDAEKIILDSYAVPSHNFQTYYVVVHKDKGAYWMTYAKPQIFPVDNWGPINMYYFKDSVRADNHSAVEGRITMGIVKLKDDMVNLFMDLVNVLPKKHILGENMMIIDGVFHAIRVFENAEVIKEVTYCTSDFIELPKEKDYLKKELEDLFITIGNLINFEMNEDQKRMASRR